MSSRANAGVTAGVNYMFAGRLSAGGEVTSFVRGSQDRTPARGS